MKASDWMIISDAERERERASWNAYEGDGRDVAELVCQELVESGMLDALDIKYVRPLLHHGGVLTIAVVLKNPQDALPDDVPEKFLGFHVVYT